MKIKFTIMIAAICFAIIPMVIYTVVTNIMVRADGGKMFEDELSNVAQAQENNLKAVMDRTRADMETIISLPGVNTAGSANSADDAINRFIGDNSLISSASLVDSSGKIIAGTNNGQKYNQYSEYSDYEDGVLYFDEIAGADDTSTASASMFMKKKITTGTLFVSYSLGSENSILSKFTSASSFYDGGSIIVIDPRGRWSAGISINANLDKQVSEEIINRIGTLSDGDITEIIEYEGVGGKTKGVLVKSGDSNGLVALTYCPAGNASYYSGKFATPIVGITILLGGLAIAGAVIVAMNITKPLSKINDTLEKILRGDHEARIRTMTNNEYGQMSRAFNNVVDEIVVSEDRYKVISDMSDNIIFEWNFKTNDVTFSNNFNKKFSYRPPSDHFGDSFLMKAKLHPDDADRYRVDLDGLEKGKNFENNEYRIKNIYGDFIWILIRTATLNDADGRPLKAVGVMVDIDRAKKSEAKLTEQASYDALTELYNRETIESQIDNEISLSEMRQSEMAVLFIDVDDFKHFNDNYSHATGDQVLKFLAKTIGKAVDGIGFAGRYGGDEFIAMIRNAEVNDPATIAAKLIEDLAAGFDADIGEHLGVSVSIGIAVIRDDYNTRVEYLIGKADDAMYSVKKSGKANYAFI